MFFVFISDRVVYDEYRYNLTPLMEIRRFWIYGDTLGLSAVALNLAGNILVFMPIGVFLPLSHSIWRNLFTVTFTGFLTSLVIETTQLYFRIGVFDVDDLLLNTIGAFVGYLFFVAVKKLVYRDDDNYRFKKTI